MEFWKAVFLQSKPSEVAVEATADRPLSRERGS